MVTKCCTLITFITKYKFSVIFILIFLTLIFTNYLKLSSKFYDHVQPKYFLLNEHIDVVYTWVNGSDPQFLRDLHKYLQANFTTTRDYSNQRFDDKYELKFSLRSLEKFAPWIGHVYIVTNGQIPYWLNLDYEKVTLVTHKEIFKDSYDLPTFSSPAIESHLHRIPGLSKYFIYFNDDVFLGAPMYIDDFISPTRGSLVYLAWPLPMCAVDCPWVYVGDGQCDSACYNVNCQMDGDDCNKDSWEHSLLPLWNSKELIYSTKTNLSYNLNITSQNQRFTTKTKDSNQNRTHDVNFNETLNRIVHSDPPKSLNHSKIALKIEPTLPNARFVIRNATNLTNSIEQHNKNVMLYDKLKRRKRTARKNRRRDFILNHSTFVSKLKNSNTNTDIYVPAHSPILISKNIMNDMHRRFTKEFKKTSRNRIRSEDDMQFAFSYYYFVMNEKENFSAEQIFDRFDTDNSGTWSDREIRTILTKLYDLPLSYAVVDHFEDILLNCSKQRRSLDVTTPEFERYVDSKLPTVSRELVTNCPLLSTILKERFGTRNKYKFEVINNAQSSHVTFKMLNSNVSEVVGHLDEIRRHTKKFICLNDNLDESKVGDNELIRAVLYDFYLSLFPQPSKFELPMDFRNRFLYIEELNQWRSYHFKLKICTYFCIFILCYVAYFNLFKRRILYRFVNKLFC